MAIKLSRLSQQGEIIRAHFPFFLFIFYEYFVDELKEKHLKVLQPIYVNLVEMFSAGQLSGLRDGQRGVWRGVYGHAHRESYTIMSPNKTPLPGNRALCTPWLA